MNKSPISWSKYKQLELISSQEPEEPTRQQTLKERILSIWESLVVSLMQPQELRVWSTSDRHGNISWSAYDPITHQSIHKISEEEIFVWIENLHSRREQF
ncbi:hypothetical protein [Scytonema sp. NUACC26]|uniref:hypothetical protein n=1 Tax=Scytonema sp. NUACC26 TaxID=3140176 RepID=UPI0038B3923D